MDNEKVYTPEVIESNPLPGQENLVSYDVSQKGSEKTGEYGPATTKEQLVPTKKVAVELLGDRLNTRTRKILSEFQFTPSGAIQVGNYQNGDQGDIRISPNGIVARDRTGLNTFALDGLTGDATFAGEIQAGSLVSGAVAVGDGNILIDGATRRMLFYDADGIPNIIIGLIS